MLTLAMGNPRRTTLIAKTEMKNRSLTRRDFLCRAGRLAAALAAPSAVVRAAGGDRTPLVGIQIAPFNLLDEGIEPCLDLMQKTAAINAIFCYSHTYYGVPYVPKGRPLEVLAPDHGVPVRAEEGRHLWPVWVRHDRANFKETSLWFSERDARSEHSGRDVLREVREPARRRGIKVYARILEPGVNEVAGKITNWGSIQSVDLDGRKAEQPCRNHPDYLAWWSAMATDLFRNYDLDGYQWGAERSGPLASLFANGTKPACFCEHCVARARRAGVDSDRAKAGFRALLKEINVPGTGAAASPDSVGERLLRCLLRHPETLAWERLWRDSLEDLAKLIYNSVKAVNRQAQVGRHLDSSNTTLNPLSRAGTDYAAMAAYTDFIKPILYHDVMGSRLAAAAENWSRRVVRPLPPAAMLELLSAFNGWQGEARPEWDGLATKGLSPAYVIHETRRIVSAVAGRAEVVPGIGLDVPTRVDGVMRPMASNPAAIESAVIGALQTGASGIMICREYDEMRLPSLRAVGRAVRS